MRVLITDWRFSSKESCNECGKSPEDYWQMAKVNGNWICIDCLGNMAIKYERLLTPFSGNSYNKKTAYPVWFKNVR